MSGDTVAALRLAVADPVVVARSFSHIRAGRADSCWWWTGAISGKGHGRFQVADHRRSRADGTTARRTYVVIAHRFGYAACTVSTRCWTCRCSPIPATTRSDRTHGAGANPTTAPTAAHRRDLVRGALAYTRRRARAVRDAAWGGTEIDQAVA